MNALFLAAVGVVAVIGIALLSEYVRPASSDEQVAEPTPLSPTLQDTILDIGEIRDAKAILERRGNTFTDGQVELYLFMKDAYQGEIEARS